MKPVLRPALLVAFAALAFAVPAPAQQVVYSEGFESGLSGWTATGLWNLEDSTDTCGSQAAPFAEGTKCAWYGSPSTCTFDTGAANSGTLTMNDWVDLPDVPAISVHFWMWIHSEYCWADGYGTQYDVFSVVVTRQVGSSLQFFQCGTGGVPATTQLNWHERQVDISAFRGQRVKVSFQFGSGDQLSNNYLGWLVDNVRILAEPGERICPSGNLSSGCPCLPNYVPVAGGCRNSTQQSATLFTDGSPVVSADTLSLRVEHMPPNASAILTQATGTGSNVFYGDGIRCVSGSLRRMGTVAAMGGVATWPPAGTDPIAIRGGIPPTGGTRYYYVFYRDTQNYCNPELYNLTDTRRITWLP